MEFDAILFTTLAVMILGVSKAGFGGVGTAVALPVMSLGVDPQVALGVLLPLLLATDAISFSAHRRHMHWPTILYALPGGIIGVLLGAYIIDAAAPAIIAGAIGALAIGFALLAISGTSPDVSGLPHWVGSVFGGLSGLTSTLAHAGGPPIHIYFLARGFPQQAFVATSAGFMAGINLLKIGPYFAVGALDWQALRLAALLVPLTIASAVGGVFLARVLSKKAFKIAVNGLMIVAGLKLLSDALL